MLILFFPLFLPHTQSKLTYKNMKKITFALAAIAAFTFAACGGGASEEGAATEETTTTEGATEGATEGSAE